MARSLSLLGLGVLLLAACRNPDQELESAVRKADAARLRHDAAVIYKDAFSGSTDKFAVVTKSAWPKSFLAFNPLRVSVYRDGVALALSPSTDSESGVYIVPEGVEHHPAVTERARFRPLRDGIYLYDFGARHD